MNSENRAGFDRINRFGFGDPCDAAIDVADEKSPCVLSGLAELVFGFEESGGERAVGIGVDYGAVGAGAIVGGFGNIAAGENGDGAEKMIGILQLNDAFDGNFAAGS